MIHMIHMVIIFIAPKIDKSYNAVEMHKDTYSIDSIQLKLAWLIRMPT